MVEYIDNSVIAQMSVPDMRHCVQYALTYPERLEGGIDRLDFSTLCRLSFAMPDKETFILLQKAYDAIKAGGATCAVLNAANEVAVSAFLNRKIGFYDITESVCEVCERLSGAKDVKSLEAILGYDKEARILTKEVLGL
jgi:1-deoxy-D-xylulose-5-phosphate reductoisomerase